MNSEITSREDVDFERYTLLMDCAHINRNTVDAYSRAWFRKHTSEYMGLEVQYPGFQARYWARCLNNAQLAAKERGLEVPHKIQGVLKPDWKRLAAGDE